MNYEQFVGAMLECTKKKLPGNYQVNRQEVMKNNGVLLTGLAIREEEREIAPVVYLEEYYKEYQKGMTLEELVELLLSKCQNKLQIPQWSADLLLDFAMMKDKIVYKLVNTKANENFLKDVPNLPILDFSVVFYLHIPISEQESGSVLIRNAHMNLWKCSVSVLYEYAKVNTPQICPYVVCSLAELMQKYGQEISDDCPILVLTNESGSYGAAALLYPKIPELIYERIGGEYYLLPASIHEFLIVPAYEDVKPVDLLEIVREVNRTELDKEEFLSDQIYYFDGEIITKM